MMDQLISVGIELQAGLREFFSGSRFPHQVRGVALDVDDYWEMAELLNGIEPYYYQDRFYRHLHPEYYFDEPWDRRRQSWRFWKNVRDDLQLFRHYSQSSGKKTDFNFRPDNWDYYCKSKGYPIGCGPVVIKVNLPENYEGSINELPRTYNERYPIKYEIRSITKAVQSVGFLNRIAILKDRILNSWKFKAIAIARKHPKTNGTAGGVLKGETTSELYMVTCGHVAGEKYTDIYYRHSAGKKIGSVVYYDMPPKCETKDPCSAETNPMLKSVDVSVIKISLKQDELAGLGKIITATMIARIADIRKNDRVTFTGKVSGRVEARVGKLTLWDQIAFRSEKNTDIRCFGRIFELVPLEEPYVLTPLAKEGDSGSWVVFEAESTKFWYGIVIARNGGDAYACFAEYVMTDANSAIPERLVCL